MTEQEIRDLFKSKNVPLDRDDVWSVQAARVVKHKALERLAAALNITYDAPQVLRSEKDEAVILVTGRLGDRSEWSIGEAAVNINYRVSGKQAAYVYAMAEKRAKDRVILKLAGLHGAYSEDEADDFKQPTKPSPVEVKQDAFGLPDINIEDEITDCTTLAALDAVMQRRKAYIDTLSEDDKADLRQVYAFKKEALRKFGEAA